MDKININNLFGGTNNKPLNVHTLYDTKGNKDKEKVSLNIERLINLRDERKNRVLIQYEKTYNSCLNRITTANELNKTDITFVAPESSFGHIDYNVVDCIDYIKRKLDELKLDTLILSESTLYISWLNLGKNRSENK